jgi:hypothetical protein
MLIVALAALGSAEWVLMKRSAEYARIAAYYEARERNWKTQIGRSETVLQTIQQGVQQGDGSEAVVAAVKRTLESLRSGAEKEHAQASAYRRAARYPWLGPPRFERAPK